SESSGSSRHWPFLGSPQSGRPQLQADADRGEGTVEIAIIGLARVDAAVHRAEEGIDTIAEADFRVRKAKRKTREAADIGHDDGTGSGGVIYFRWIDCRKRAM